MDIVPLILGNYIMIAELLGLWVMLESNAHLKQRTIRTTRVVILLILLEAVLWAIERWTRELDHLTFARLILTPTVYLLHPIIMLGIMDMAEFIDKHRVLYYVPILLILPRFLGLLGIQSAVMWSDMLTAMTSLPFALRFFRKLSLQEKTKPS